ncbi:hypothetical protein [Nesterenkonia pannonica]|uniref:hypothetical protein n=1 Tax=Nesterenkonia pannonica TaxID=1548602 RepID=UPI00216449D6|nr:hypothetical protein [Nesterenkonia pannonica]
MPRDVGEPYAAPHTLNRDSTPTPEVQRVRGHRRLSVGSVLIFVAGCLAALIGAAVFTAWLLGGRSAGPPQDVQALLPSPQLTPETAASLQGGDEANETSGEMLRDLMKERPLLFCRGRAKRLRSTRFLSRAWPTSS